MIPRPLGEIEAADIDALLGRAEEGPTLDFKRDLPADDREARKEFVADVAALANTKGGDLVYGVDDDGNGVASRVVPAMFNPDEVITRLTNVLTDRLEPRLHGVQMRAVEVDETAGRVLVVRVPMSFAGIHRSLFDAHFWVRESRSKRFLDVPGIANRLRDLLGREDRITDFFAKRYAAVLGDAYPLPLIPGPKLVIHVLPTRDILSGEEVDLAPLDQPGNFVILPSGHSGMATRTFEGVLHHAPLHQGFVRAATLLFRSGVVEAVGAALPRGTPEDIRSLPLEAVEAMCVGFLRLALKPAAQHMTAGWPITLRIALVGAHLLPGRSMNRDVQWHFDEMPPIRVHTPVLVFPDVLVEAIPQSIPLLLQTTFDRLWQSWGYPRSLSFQTHEGATNWQRERQ